MKVKPAIEGLYAITPDIPDTDELLRRVRLALEGGAKVLQYRNKTADAALKFTQAKALRQLTFEFKTTFIVNDDAFLAAQVDANGVHLGGDDGNVATARTLLGGSKIIGVSCYNRALLAQEAVGQGADYVAFGAFYPSTVKPGALKADVSLLQTVGNNLGVPIVAIGGITLSNGKDLINAGADALAVISALFDVIDIKVAARGFSTLFSRN